METCGGSCHRGALGGVGIYRLVAFGVCGVCRSLYVGGQGKGADATGEGGNVGIVRVLDAYEVFPRGKCLKYRGLVFAGQGKGARLGGLGSRLEEASPSVGSVGIGSQQQALHLAARGALSGQAGVEHGYVVAEYAGSGG